MGQVQIRDAEREILRLKWVLFLRERVNVSVDTLFSLNLKVL